MQTRLATPADVPAIAAIYNHAIVHTIASFWTETRPEAEIAEQLAEAGARYPWLVADADGQVLGVAWSKRWNPRQAYDLTCEVSIYLAPDAQGRGIGKLLYTDLFSRLASIGYEQVLAGISLPNDASARLHESMGMWHVGTYRGIGRKFGKAIDVGYWQGTLGEPAG